MTFVKSTPNPGIPLCVPYWDEKEALNAGATYSEQNGFLAPPDIDKDAVWKWLPRMYAVEPGTPALIPDMLPVTTWEQNIRHLMGQPVWDRIRKHAYKAAGYRCEICGDRGPMEAHELWHLSNETGIQRLERLLALCPTCHKGFHLGLAKRLGVYPDVLQQLMRVNGWNTRELAKALDDSYEVWKQRCEWDWKLDLSWLADSGYLYV